MYLCVCECVCAVTREDGALLAPVREREKREGGCHPPLQVYLSLFTGPAGQSGGIATSPALSQNVAANGF